MFRRKISKKTVIARIYFWFYRALKQEEPPEEEDTCGIRKVMILSLLACLFLYPIAYAIGLLFMKIAGTRVRVILFLLVGGFAYWAYRSGEVVAAVLLLVVVLACLVVAGVLVYFLVDWLSDRVPDSVGDWFVNYDLAGTRLAFPIYPWMVFLLVLQIAGGYFWFARPETISFVVGLLLVAFFFVSMLEALVLLLF